LPLSPSIIPHLSLAFDRQNGPILYPKLGIFDICKEGLYLLISPDTCHKNDERKKEGDFLGNVNRDEVLPNNQKIDHSIHKKKSDEALYSPCRNDKQFSRWEIRAEKSRAHRMKGKKQVQLISNRRKCSFGEKESR